MKFDFSSYNLTKCVEELIEWKYKTGVLVDGEFRKVCEDYPKVDLKVLESEILFEVARRYKKINDDSIYGVLEKCYIWNRVEKPNKASKYLMERQAESIVDFIKKGRDSK